MPEAKVMIITDPYVGKGLLKNTLNQIGYTSIVEAESGVDALGKIAKEDFHLIISDWNMNENDGAKFIQLVKDSDITSRIPIILVTNEATKGEAQGALKAAKIGANNFIVRPFSADALKEKIERVISGYRIMVIDDSSTTRKVITNILGQIGHSDVIEAENGIDALAKLAQNKVDLILCDWNMPNMNGLQFVKSLRSMKTYGNIPILMVTTNAAKGEIIQALQAGASDYVAKPFTPKVIQQKISKLLGR